VLGCCPMRRLSTGALSLHCLCIVATSVADVSARKLNWSEHSVAAVQSS
jgi:hypothetical protein